MNLFELHEQFEIETLNTLKSGRILDMFIFGGGTMLRLCHDLNRYSADLDFWKIRPSDDKDIFVRLKKILESKYEITDGQIKRFTILLEIRSSHFPKRLKIEIRRNVENWEFEDKIAFSKYSTHQVMLKAHTLEQTLKNKISALLNRKEIRDAFDIEFILRRGISLPPLSAMQVRTILNRLSEFKDRDFKVTLGSIIEDELRSYYFENRFTYLEEQLNFLLKT